MNIISTGVGIYIKGGITPMYSVPSFGPGQVGYTTTAYSSLNGSIANGTTVLTISLLPGVWLIFYNALLQAANATGSKYIGTDLNAGSTLITSRNVTVSNSQDNQSLNLSCAVTAYTPTTYNVVVSANPTPLNIIGGAAYNFITATRIA